MDPTLIAAAISAAGSIGSGYLAGRSGGTQETKTQKRQRHLIDQLVESLGGSGPYSALYSTNEDDFTKAFVEPAKSMFRNQIVPQIQQASIFGGQQRGTGLDDQLLRAGVDLDQLLNQQYMTFRNQGKDRMQNTIGSILGAGAGAIPAMGQQQALMSGLSGYLQSTPFSKGVANMFGQSNNTQNMDRMMQNTYQEPTPRGYLPDYPVGDKRWGNLT